MVMSTNGANTNSPLYVYGATGFKQASGYNLEEWDIELSGDLGRRNIRAMIDTSPVIGAALLALEVLMRQVHWETVPADDSAAAKEVADFIDGCCDDMETAWEDFVGEHLGFLPWGWQWYEFEYKLREGPQDDLPYQRQHALGTGGSTRKPPPSSRFDDGKYGWHRFGMRSQESLLRWEFTADGADLLGMWQIPAPTYALKFVPYAKSMNFRTRTTKGNPEGRALDPETPIPTPDGWRRLDELQPGAKVFDERGRIRYVTARADWEDRPCYRVSFNDGSSIIADAEHLWYTDTKRDRDHRLPGSIKTTAEIAQTTHRVANIERGKHVSNHSIPWAGPLDYPEQVLPIEPYFLGVWLGDGTAVNSDISCHGDDAEETCALIGASAGYTARVDQNGRPGENGRRLRIRGSAPWAEDNPQRLLRTMGLLGNKHIPPAYLRGSIEQRTALLAGLMDSDGHADRVGRCEFANTNRDLVDGVAELVRSLGCRAKVWQKHHAGDPSTGLGNTVSDSWTVKFAPTWTPFRLSRKSARIVTQHTRQQHYITAVESVEPRRTVCIEVDGPGHMFLAGESMVPTHNSLLRNVWTSFKFAKNLMVAEGIGIERDLTGLPKAEVPVEILQAGTGNGTPADKATYDAIQRIVNNIRVDEQGGVIWPLDYDEQGNKRFELSLMASPGQKQIDTNMVIGRYEQRELMAFLADFLLIGTVGPGSRALVDPRMNLFSLAGESTLTQSGGTLNTRAIPQLCSLNRIDERLWPKRIPGRVNLVKLLDLANYVLAISQANAASPLAPDVRQELLRRGDLPTADTGATVEDTQPNADAETQAESDAAQARQQQAGGSAEPKEPPQRVPNPVQTSERPAVYPDSWPDWLVHTTDDLLRDRPKDVPPRVYAEIVIGAAQAQLKRNPGWSREHARVFEMGETKA